MATMTVDCGSFDRYSYNGVTQYGGIVNFSIPAGATITGCSVSFTTHAAGGNTADRAFSINGTRAHSGWASAGGLNAYLLQPGNNTFRVTLKSTTPGGYTVCWWDISGITLTITYTEGSGGGGGSTGGGGPVVISPSSIDAGAGSITVTCPAEAGIWHMIDWTFGSYSGSWSHPWEAGGTGTISIPLSWIAEMPSATQGTLAIRVRRSTTPAMPYSFATDQTTNITINVPASVVPSISDFMATLVPNGVPGTIAGYVQNMSKVALAMTAAGGSYSPITGYSITGGGISSSAASGTFGPFNLSGDVVFTAKVTDARGRTATRQVAINIMPYTAPAFSSPEAWRSSDAGVKNQKGTFAMLKSGVVYSSLGGQNSVTLKGVVHIKGGTVPAYTSMTPDTEWITGGGLLLVTKTYIAQMEVADLISSRTVEFTIPTKKTGISIMAGMQGIAFGKSAEIPGYAEFGWPIYNCPHRVGDVLQTTNPEHPEDSWPGTTWAAYGAGRVLVGIDSTQTEFDTVDKEGGEETHVLTTAEMPIHSHRQQRWDWNGLIADANSLLGGGATGSEGGHTPTTAVPYSYRTNLGAVNTQNAGDGEAHNNLQPYKVVYMWLRTA